MHKTVLTLALALGGAAVTAAAPQDGPGTGELTIRAAGFAHSRGHAVIDHGLFGPSEALGFSAGFVLSLLSGRPDFEQLAFDFKPPAQALQVRVK